MIKRIWTHPGKFHLDDVTGCAILSLLYPSARIIREVPSIAVLSLQEDAVVDVGGEYSPQLNNFDHHQDVGLPCASFLIYKKFKGRLLGDISLKRLDKLMKIIDVLDRGIEGVSIPSELQQPYAFISYFKLVSLNNTSQNTGFMQCMDYMKNIIGGLIQREKSNKALLGLYKSEEGVYLDGAVFFVPEEFTFKALDLRKAFKGEEEKPRMAVYPSLRKEGEMVLTIFRGDLSALSRKSCKRAIDFVDRIPMAIYENKRDLLQDVKEIIKV